VECRENVLCCSADAKGLIDEYDVRDDEVALPDAYDPFEMESYSYSQTPYESSYVNNNPYGMIVGYDDYEDYDDSSYTSYNVTMQGKKESDPVHVRQVVNKSLLMPLNTHGDRYYDAHLTSVTNSRAFELEDQYRTVARKKGSETIGDQCESWYDNGNNYRNADEDMDHVNFSGERVRKFRTPASTLADYKTALAERNSTNKAEHVRYLERRKYSREKCPFLEV